MAAPSLFRLLLVPMILVVLVLTVVLTFWAGQAAKRPLLEDQVRALEGLTQQISSQLDQALAERMYDIQSLISVSQFQTITNNPARQRAYLNDLSGAFPAYAWIGFADRDGYVRVATNGLLEGEFVGARPWYQAGKNRPTTQDLHQAVLLGRLLQSDNPDLLRFVDVAAPVFGADGQWVGVLGAHLYEDWVRRVLSSVIAPIEDRHNVQVMVFNSRHEFVIGSASLSADHRDLVSTQLMRETERSYVRETWSNGSRGLTVFAKTEGFASFPSLGWTVLVHRPDRELLHSARQLQIQMVVAGVVCAIFSTALLGLILKRRLAPLQGLAKDLRRVLDIEDLSDLNHGAGVAEVALIEDNLKDLAARLHVNESELQRVRDDRDSDREEMRNLRVYAERDPLTGVCNRRGLERVLQRLECEREQAVFAVAVILCDIDHFKQINDRFGHAAGDAVLRRFAQVLNGLIRTEDVLVRTGGEEFLVLLTDTSLAKAEALAHRLRSGIEAGRFETDQGEMAVTASFGVAGQARHRGADISALIDLADQRMYQAKRNGRNRVIVA